MAMSCPRNVVALVLGLLLSQGMLHWAHGIQLQSRWKEDPGRRDGLNNFLYHLGMSWIHRLYYRAISWSDEQNIFQNGQYFTVHGYRGPQSNVFSHKLVADNKTLSTVNMGEFGGQLIARTYIDKKDRLRASLSDPNTEKDVLQATWTRKTGSRELLFELKHIPSGTVLRSAFLKQ